MQYTRITHSVKREINAATELDNAGVFQIALFEGWIEWKDFPEGNQLTHKGKANVTVSLFASPNLLLQLQ